MGTLAYLLAIIAETISCMCAQALRDVVPPFQLNFLRYVAQLLFTIVLVILKGMDITIFISHFQFYTVLTSVLSMIYNVSFYSAASILPLGTLVMVLGIVQIVGILIIQRVLFMETISFFKIIVIPVTLVGISLMLEPVVHFEDMGSFVDTYIGSSSQEHSTYVGIILAIIAGLTSAIYVSIVNNKLQNVQMVIISMWFGTVGSICSLILAFYIDELQFQITLQDGLLVLGHSSATAICALFTIYGSQHTPLITWAIIDNLRIVLNILMQYTVMRSVMPVSTNAYEISGIVITLACIVYAVVCDVYIEMANANSQII